LRRYQEKAVKLIFSDNDLGRVAALQRAFSGRSDLFAVHVSRRGELARVPDLDAIYLSVMGAERFGARPIIHSAQVLNVTAEDREAGWPPYIIAGVAMKSDDPREPKFELGLIVRCVIEAVNRFNSECSAKISIIELGGSWIGLEKMSPEEAGDIIRRNSENPSPT
jgi:hypothetical protein